MEYDYYEQDDNADNLKMILMLLMSWRRWWCWLCGHDDNEGGDCVVSYHTSNVLSKSNEKDDDIFYDYNISIMVMITDDVKDNYR
jgi:hypothetical protein